MTDGPIKLMCSIGFNSREPENGRGGGGGGEVSLQQLKAQYKSAEKYAFLFLNSITKQYRKIVELVEKRKANPHVFSFPMFRVWWDTESSPERYWREPRSRRGGGGGGKRETINIPNAIHCYYQGSGAVLRVEVDVLGCPS